MAGTQGAEMALQNQVILVPETTAGVLNTSGVAVYRTDITTEGSGWEHMQRWVERNADGYNAPISTALAAEEGQISGGWVPRYALIPSILDAACGEAFSDVVAASVRTRKWRLPESGRRSIITYSGFYGVLESAVLLEYGKLLALSFSNVRSGDTAGNISWHFNQVTRLQEIRMSGGVSEVQTITRNATVPTAGGYTITVTNPDTGVSATTASIAFDANAAAIQAALEALANVAPGDVVVTGGPFSSATLVTLTFGGAFAQEDVAPVTIASIDLLPLPTFTVATATPGAAGAISTIDSPSIETDHWYVYKADNWTDLNAIDMADPADPLRLATVQAHEFGVDGLVGPTWFEDREKFAASHVDRKPTVTASVTMQKSDTGQCEEIYSSEAGCRSTPMWIRMAAKCATDEFWVDLWCARNAQPGYPVADDIYQHQYPLTRIANLEAANTWLSGCVFTHRVAA